jgi:NHLM bacteriocin system ABC transporter ATP-binding protein
MSFTTAGRLNELGSIRELACNAAFSVEDPEKVWIVIAGTLDLFLVNTAGNGFGGPRSYIVRLRQGDALFGFYPGNATGARLVANPGPETKLLYLERAQLEDTGGSLERQWWLALLEQWIATIGMAAADAIAPKSFVRLSAGQEYTFEDGPGAVLSLEQLLWVRPVRGTTRFLASDMVPALPLNEYFPVTRHTWLQCAPHTSLTCIDTQTWLEQDRERLGLRAFSDLMRAYLIYRRKDQEERERKRMLASAEADGLRIEHALRTLAAPLNESGEEPEGAAISGDQLLRACEAVSRAAAIKIQAPVGSLAAMNERDPISAIAKASGVRMRLVLLRGRWWKQDHGPMLGFRASDNRPVALLPRSPANYRIFDPTLEQSVNVTPEIAAEMKESAYVFYRHFPAQVLKISDLFGFALVGCRRDIVMIVLMGIAAGLLALLPPIFTGIIFDDVIPGAQRHALNELIGFLIVSGFASALFSLTRQIAVIRLEGKIDVSMQAAVWDRTMALPVPFFRQYAAGELAMRGLVIGQIRQILTGSTVASILSGVFSVFSLALLFFYSWELAILATGLTALAVLVSSVCGYFTIRYQRQMFEVQGRVSGMVLQFINGIAKFRVSGTEARVFARWAREFTKQKLIYCRSRKFSNGLAVFNAGFPVLAYGAIFYCAAYLMAASPLTHMSSGHFLAFFAAFTQFLGAALALSSAALATLTIVPLAERAKPILETMPEVDTKKTDPGELSGHIEMDHVVFRYHKDMPVVINDISLSILPGQFVAFVGMSGSGKSTLFRLLLGFEKPESGAIYFDRQELAGLDLQAVRQQLGVVLQNGRVLTGDIFSNIVGSTRLTIEDAWEAARLSGLDHDIKEMPMGMHTVVSEAGGGLSGGQRQRLMIARAVVGQPRILLFDEATSALDNHTQAIVSKSLETLNATRIVIAHRLSTVISADHIFVLDKGRIAQSGSYEELMREEGVFRELAKRQLN